MITALGMSAKRKQSGTIKSNMSEIPVQKQNPNRAKSNHSGKESLHGLPVSWTCQVTILQHA
jgi:hypothetical protein